jgi:hypothetical protein
MGSTIKESELVKESHKEEEVSPAATQRVRCFTPFSSAFSEKAFVSKSTKAMGPNRIRAAVTLRAMPLRSKCKGPRD